eukprot:CAMPEP_0177625830 /NCGR_PEP_ID=MMETSP0419_2-20121207/30320_1 /TAXON_ID=582737 /ORGANISM="Tetraselmis sp., Strain GSL018" /LENGTH=60 /DNA_ID=CAMNT_0019126825 /DNA_START=17 /DNA_END=195 /DNA_ORIENTATION=-
MARDPRLQKPPAVRLPPEDHFTQRNCYFSSETRSPEDNACKEPAADREADMRQPNQLLQA